MSDIRFFSLIGVAAAALIALAMVFPQGEGARSPKPFGHATAAQRAAWEKAHKPAAPVVKAPKPVF